MIDVVFPNKEQYDIAYSIVTNELGYVGQPRLVLLENDKVIGGLFLEPPMSYTLNGKKYTEPLSEYKFDIFIKKNKRGKGYSKLLLDKMIEDFVYNFPNAEQIRGEVINRRLEKYLKNNYNFSCDSGNEENITYCYLLKNQAKKLLNNKKFMSGGNVLLAPNGQPSNLTPEQYRLVRTPQFISWFGNWIDSPETASKVVDKNGEPLVVYHSYISKKNKFKSFNVFKTKLKYEVGTHFGSKEQAETNITFKIRERGYKGFNWETKIYECFLNIKKIKRVKDRRYWLPETIFKDLYPIKKVDWFEFDKGKENIDLFLKEIKGKVDGLVYNNDFEHGGNSYIVFEPNQIKLADGTNTTFDSKNPDIRFSLGGEIEEYKKQGILDLNFYPTNSKHAKEHGIDAKNPLYLQNLIVKESDRLKFIGKKVLLYLDEYAKQNGNDVIFGYVNQKATMTKDNRTGYFTEFTDVDWIKHWLFRNGYCVKRETNNFYKVLDKEKKDTTFDSNNPDIRFKTGGSIRKPKKRTISQTPAPKKDRIYGSKINKPKSSESKSKASSIILSPSVIKSIRTKINQHNEEYPNKKIPLSSAKAVVRRGMGAYSSTHRPTISGGKPNSRVAWGLARLNAFIYKIVKGKSKSGKYKQDDDLINELGYRVKPYAYGGQITDEEKETYKKWKELVNMSRLELEKFYNSQEGKVAGLSPSEAKKAGIDSGRESARWIMKMKYVPVKEWNSNMWRWAKKQISFISRMSGVKGKLYDEKGRKTRKHLALLIWGHNPEK